MITGNSIFKYSYECFVENHIFINLLSKLLESYVEPHSTSFRCHIINKTYYYVNCETLTKWLLNGSSSINTYTLIIQDVSYILLKKCFSENVDIFIIVDPSILKYWKEKYAHIIEKEAEIPKGVEIINNIDKSKLKSIAIQESAWKKYDQTVLKFVENLILPEMKNPNIIFGDQMFSDEKRDEFDTRESIFELISRSYLWIFNRKSYYFKNRKRNFYNRSCKKLLWYTDFHEYGLSCVPLIYTFTLVDISFDCIEQGLRINFRKRPYDPKYRIIKKEPRSNKINIDEEIYQEEKIDFWTGYKRFGDQFLKRTYTALIDGKDLTLMTSSADLWPENKISITVDSTNTTKNFIQKNFIVIDKQKVPEILKKLEIELITEEISIESESSISDGNYPLFPNQNKMEICQCEDIVDLDLYPHIMDSNNYYIKYVQESYENTYKIENNQYEEEIESNLNEDNKNDFFLQMKVTSDGSSIFFVRRANNIYVQDEYARNSTKYSLTVGTEKHLLEICFFENINKVYFECHENYSKSKFVTQEIIQKFYNEHDHNRTVMWVIAKTVQLNGLKWHEDINAIDFSFCLHNEKSFLTGESEDKDTSLLISDLPNDLVIIVVDTYSWTQKLEYMTVGSDDDEKSNKNCNEIPDPGKKKSLPLQKKYAIGQSIAKKIRSENDSMFLTGNRSNLPKNPNKLYDIINNKVVKFPIIKEGLLDSSATTLAESSKQTLIKSKQQVRDKAIKLLDDKFKPNPTPPVIKKEICKPITRRRKTLGSHLELKKASPSNSSNLSPTTNQSLHDTDNNTNTLEKKKIFFDDHQYIGRNKRFLNQWNEQQKLLVGNNNQDKVNERKDIINNNDFGRQENPVDDLRNFLYTDRSNLKESSIIPKKRRLTLHGPVNINSNNENFDSVNTEIQPDIKISYNKNLPNSSSKNYILPFITYDCSKRMPNTLPGHNKSQADISVKNIDQSPSTSLDEPNAAIHRAFFYRNMSSDSENSQENSSFNDMSNSKKKINTKWSSDEKKDTISKKKRKSRKRTDSDVSEKKKVVKMDSQSSDETNSSNLQTTSQMKHEEKINSTTSRKDSKSTVGNTSVERKIPNRTTTTTDSNSINSAESQLKASDLKSMDPTAGPISNRRQPMCVDKNDGSTSSSRADIQTEKAPARPISSRRNEITNEEMNLLLNSITPLQGDSNIAVDINTTAKVKITNQHTSSDGHRINSIDLQLQQPQSETSDLNLMKTPARPIVTRRQSICVDNNDDIQKAAPHLTLSQEHSIANEQTNSSMTLSRGDSNIAIGNNTENHPINSVYVILQQAQSAASDLKLMQPPARPVKNRRKSICVDNSDPTNGRQPYSTYVQQQNTPRRPISSRRHSVANEQMNSDMIPSRENSAIVNHTAARREKYSECHPINSGDLKLQQTQSENSDLMLMQPPLARPILNRRQSVCFGNNDPNLGRQSSPIYAQPQNTIESHPINFVDLTSQQSQSDASDSNLTHPPVRPILKRRQTICVHNNDAILGRQSPPTHVNQQNSVARPILSRRNSITVNDPPFGSQIIHYNPISSRLHTVHIDPTFISQTMPNLQPANPSASQMSSVRQETVINNDQAIVVYDDDNHDIANCNEAPFLNQTNPSNYRHMPSRRHPIAVDGSQNSPPITTDYPVLPRRVTFADDSNNPDFGNCLEPSHQESSSSARTILPGRQIISIGNNIPSLVSNINREHSQSTSTRNRTQLTIGDYTAAVANIFNYMRANNIDTNQLNLERHIQSQQLINSNHFRNQNEINSSRPVYALRQQMSSYNNNNQIPSQINATFTDTSRGNSYNGNNLNTTVWANNPFSDEQPSGSLSNFRDFRPNTTQVENHLNYHRLQTDYVRHSAPRPPPPPYPNFQNQSINNPSPLFRHNSYVTLTSNYHPDNQWNHSQQQPRAQHLNRIQPWATNPYIEEQPIDRASLLLHHNIPSARHYHPDSQWYQPQQQARSHNRFQRWTNNPYTRSDEQPIDRAPPLYNNVPSGRHYHLDSQWYQPQQQARLHNRIQPWATNPYSDEQQ